MIIIYPLGNVAAGGVIATGNLYHPTFEELLYYVVQSHFIEEYPLLGWDFVYQSSGLALQHLFVLFDLFPNQQILPGIKYKSHFDEFAQFKVVYYHHIEGFFNNKILQHVPDKLKEAQRIPSTNRTAFLLAEEAIDDRHERIVRIFDHCLRTHYLHIDDTMYKDFFNRTREFLNENLYKPLKKFVPEGAHYDYFHSGQWTIEKKNIRLKEHDIICRVIRVLHTQHGASFESAAVPICGYVGAVKFSPSALCLDMIDCEFYVNTRCWQ